jgi:cytoskeletal protein CcmA (bactofilin family)
MKPPGPPSSPDIPRRVVDIPGAPRRRVAEDEPAAGPTATPAVAGAARSPAPPEKQTSERRLIVGKEISLAGEINACDHLVVEGQIEAKLKECRVIEVADSGVFKGSAEIEEADIAGTFDGDISVRGKLRVRGSGMISGNIRYGRIEVEAGGRLIGTVQPLESDTAGAAPAASAAPEPPTQGRPSPGSTSTATGGVVHSLAEVSEPRGEPVD